MKENIGLVSDNRFANCYREGIGAWSSSGEFGSEDGTARYGRQRFQRTYALHRNLISDTFAGASSLYRSMWWKDMRFKIAIGVIILVRIIL